MHRAVKSLQIKQSDLVVLCLRTFLSFCEQVGAQLKNGTNSNVLGTFYVVTSTLANGVTYKTSNVQPMRLLKLADINVYITFCVVFSAARVDR